jgi:hypothetical protein
MSSFRLGIVEGFYGPPWSWPERLELATFLAGADYSFYLYAPKGDAFLRRRWREPWPSEQAAAIRGFSSRLGELGMGFGVGLSPLGLEADRLLSKVDELVGCGANHLALLFDDMRGDEPGLVARQLSAAHAVRARFPKLALSLCPTYYSLDPVLDRLFGARPTDYLERLGRELDPAVEIFWTGERICSAAYSTEHLGRVAAILRRKPLLWDNYPVNDTPRLSRFLHLSAVTGRPAALRGQLSGHLANPMLQPLLSRVPLLTLARSYRQGEGYDSARAFEAAARRAVGDELAGLLVRDHKLFHEGGLDALTAGDRANLRADYARVDHPGAREVLSWLDGSSTVTAELIDSQQ